MSSGLFERANIFAAASAAFSGSETSVTGMPVGVAAVEKALVQLVVLRSGGQAITGLVVFPATSPDSASESPAMVT